MIYTYTEKQSQAKQREATEGLTIERLVYHRMESSIILPVFYLLFYFNRNGNDDIFKRCDRLSLYLYSELVCVCVYVWSVFSEIYTQNNYAFLTMVSKFYYISAYQQTESRIFLFLMKIKCVRVRNEC